MSPSTKIGPLPTCEGDILPRKIVRGDKTFGWEYISCDTGNFRMSTHNRHTGDTNQATHTYSNQTCTDLQPSLSI